MATPLDFDSASRRQTNDSSEFQRTGPPTNSRRQMLSLMLRMLGRAYVVKPADYANSVREMRPYRGREGNQHG